MKTLAECEKCGGSIETEETYSGLEIQCPTCMTYVVAPDAGEVLARIPKRKKLLKWLGISCLTFVVALLVIGFIGVALQQSSVPTTRRTPEALPPAPVTLRSSKTEVEIRNKGEESLNEVEIIIDNKYSILLNRLQGGRTFRTSLNNFTDKNGSRFQPFSQRANHFVC